MGRGLRIHPPLFEHSLGLIGSKALFSQLGPFDGPALAPSFDLG